MIRNRVATLILLAIDTPLKTNMAMENPPFKDAFPIEHGDFPASHVSFRGGNFFPTYEATQHPPLVYL